MKSQSLTAEKLQNSRRCFQSVSLWPELDSITNRLILALDKNKEATVTELPIRSAEEGGEGVQELTVSVAAANWISKLNELNDLFPLKEEQRTGQKAFLGWHFVFSPLAGFGKSLIKPCSESLLATLVTWGLMSWLSHINPLAAANRLSWP